MGGSMKRVALAVAAAALLAACGLVLVLTPPEDMPMAKEGTEGTALLTSLDTDVNHPTQQIQILLGRLNKRLARTQMLVKLGKADYKNRKKGSETMMHSKSLYATPGGLAGGPTAEVSRLIRVHAR